MVALAATAVTAFGLFWRARTGVVAHGFGRDPAYVSILGLDSIAATRKSARYATDRWARLG